MSASLRSIIDGLRASRRAHVVIVNLRFLLGFAFLPAGLKKVLGQPFTDPDKHGAFHDFLRAFHATGGFYRFVGCLQLVAATLLLTQLRAAWGALVAFPIVTAIVALCWSTGVVPTAIVATLMWLGTAALVIWDRDELRGASERDHRAEPAASALIDRRVWAACGAAIAIVYLALTALAGEVYRPRRVELDRPSFYLLLALPLLPVGAWLIERRRKRHAIASSGRHGSPRP